MAEKVARHEYKPAKSNPFHCEVCPYLRGNPIHTKPANGQYVRGTAHPTKLG
jgi:hypothetical protein